MAWWRTAYVGQKVTPLKGFPTSPNGSWARSFPGAKYPREGDILTIREIFKYEDYSLGVRFYEIVNGQYTNAGRYHGDGSSEPAFDIRLFRPVDDLKQQSGMAVFRAILNGAPVKESEPA